ncbi:MAG TPA: hypothetical protein VHZ55_01870 [Bryobacteraceae bacterium]|nr:hypothetical protein [Bryobacteraceae bacterium]
MRQALWIFQKDVRHLRIQIAITLALQALYAFFDIRSSAENNIETAERT